MFEFIFDYAFQEVYIYTTHLYLQLSVFHLKKWRDQKGVQILSLFDQIL